MSYYVVCEQKCCFSQGWRCLFLCCEMWTGLGSANTLLSRISFGAYVGNEMQLLNPLSANSSLDLEVWDGGFQSGHKALCVWYISLLRSIIQFDIEIQSYIEVSVIIKHRPGEKPNSTNVSGINIHSQRKEIFNSCFWFQWLLTNSKCMEIIFKVRKVSASSFLSWAWRPAGFELLVCME